MIRIFLPRLLFTLALLTGGSHASPAASQTASPRIATLSWEVTEHVLQLGVTPVAVADAPEYRRWVVHPALPDAVPNAGTRSEPNLDLLAQLRPDLILIPPLLADVRAKLERIAPVLVYGDFTQTRDNFALQRENFLDLGERLGRGDAARRQLAAMDARIAALRARIAAHFADAPPSVAVLRFTAPTTVLINGPNSMPQHAMRLLGLEPAIPVETSRWGVVQVPVTTLARVDQGVVLYLEPFTQRERLFGTALWQQMPFVRAQRFAAMRATWTHGGAFCVEQLASAITDALLTLPGNAVAP